MKNYLVLDGWIHILVGTHESYTQWVLDVEARKLVCGFVEDGTHWESLDGDLLENLQEDIEHNVLWEIVHGTFDAEEMDLIETDTLPDWAMDDTVR